MKRIALAEPGTNELPCEPHCDRTARFVQYTRLMRYPDTIDVEVMPAGDGQSTLALYSRSLVGRKDFGVNRARLRRWLAALGLCVVVRTLSAGGSNRSMKPISAATARPRSCGLAYSIGL